MKKGFLGKKFPTFFGLIFLIAAIATGLYFINQGKFSLTKSDSTAIPKKIKITNISDKQFTVSWVTDEPTTGYIKYDQTPKVKTEAKDDRDKLTGEQTKNLIHYVTVRNLTPAKTYHFKIGSGSRLYDNNGQAYQVTSGPTIGSAGEAKIVSGRVLEANKNPAKGIIVYLSSPNIAPASTLTDVEGRWAIYLNKTRNSNLSSYAEYDPEATVLDIEIEASKESTAAITITKNAFPVPDIILGQGPYDFRNKAIAKDAPLQAESTPIIEDEATTELQEKEEESELIQEEIPSQFNLQPLGSPVSNPYTVIITNPAVEGEEINTTLPEIRGKGPADKVINIRIESPTTHTGTVTINEDGSWSFTPNTDLEPGNHTVYVNFLDDDGETQEIARNFIVLAADTSDLPALVSTPSASLVPTVSPSPFPSPTILPSPSARATIPSTESGIPTTGTILPTFLVFLASLVLILPGLTLILNIDKDKKKLT
ncbi:Ig-like domain-containing protein [Patescibacteria group bacterium]